MINLFRSFFTLLLIIGIISCNTPESKKEVETVSSDSIPEKVVEIKKQIVFNDTLNQLAALIAGVDSTKYTYIDSSALKNKTWIDYSKKMNSSWKRYDSLHAIPMKDWSKTELGNNTNFTLFYPFAGADILNAYTLFPQAKNYILIGLEPVGDLPDKTTLNNPTDFSTYCQSVNASLHAIMNFSFFRTISMASDFNNKELNGTIHLLVLFLKRMNMNIVSIKHLAITATGEEKYYTNYTDLMADSLLNKGSVIEFTDGKTIQKVYYFSVDLSDNKFKANNALKNYVINQAPFKTYLKSASYLMHKTYFSEIRNLILYNSKSILEDDSGIPYKYFDTNKWNINLYGTYTGTIPMFSGHYQSELEQAYKNTKLVEPLEFGIGYKHKKGESNLLLATKK